VYEYTEIGWEGRPDDLALFILIGGCQCSGEEGVMPMLAKDVHRIGLSFRSHKTLKSSLQLLYLQDTSKIKVG